MSGSELESMLNEWSVSASELANHIGVHRTTIYRWISGQVVIPQVANLAIRSFFESKSHQFGQKPG